MDLREFKREAMRRGHYYDNKPAAMAYWAKCWGLGYHSELWAYKSYQVGNFSYQSGPVALRHGKYTNTVCKINGEAVSEYQFRKALATFCAPDLTPDERAYIDHFTEYVERARRLAKEIYEMKAADYDMRDYVRNNVFGRVQASTVFHTY